MSEFYYLQPLMNIGEYKGYWIFFGKSSNLRQEKLLESILITADVVGLCSSIPHDGRLEILWKHHDKFRTKVVSTKGIIKMTKFVVKNNLYVFDREFYQQILGTAIGTKFALPP